MIDYGKHILVFLFFMLLLAIPVLFGLSYSIYEESNTNYVLDNGVICEDRQISYKGAPEKLYNCNDGLTYNNPSTYREIEAIR